MDWWKMEEGGGREFYHDWTSYHLVIGNKTSRTLSLVLLLFEEATKTAEVFLSNRKFTKHRFSSHSDIKICPFSCTKTKTLLISGCRLKFFCHFINSWPFEMVSIPYSLLNEESHSTRALYIPLVPSKEVALLRINVTFHQLAICFLQIFIPKIFPSM